MIIIDYKEKNHKDIIRACVKALKQGKVIVYPTDTSYGLGCDASNKKAVLKFYKIKERGFNKPVHVVVPSIKFAKTAGVWELSATKLAKKFWPGAVSLVLPYNLPNLSNTLKPSIKRFAAGTKTVGLRMPNNFIALDLAKNLGKPIPATSANPAGGYDSYTAKDIVDQFKDKKYKPDIIINAGKLKKRKPSTLVKISQGQIEILRPGPISLKQIQKALN